MYNVSLDAKFGCLHLRMQMIIGIYLMIHQFQELVKIILKQKMRTAFSIVK